MTSIILFVDYILSEVIIMQIASFIKQSVLNTNAFLYRQTNIGEIMITLTKWMCYFESKKCVKMTHFISRIINL